MRWSWDLISLFIRVVVLLVMADSIMHSSVDYRYHNTARFSVLLLHYSYYILHTYTHYQDAYKHTRNGCLANLS
jgi:hypothetical protein